MQRRRLMSPSKMTRGKWEMYTSRECIEYLQENRKQNWSFDWSFEERKQRKAKESKRKQVSWLRNNRRREGASKRRGTSINTAFILSSFFFFTVVVVVFLWSSSYLISVIMLSYCLQLTIMAIVSVLSEGRSSSWSSVRIILEVFIHPCLCHSSQGGVTILCRILSPSLTSKLPVSLL